ASRRLFPVVVIGYMANDVLPARMGEIVRAYALEQREGISKTTTLATVFVERVFDGLAMLAFLGAVAVFVPFAATLQQVAALTAALFLTLTAFLFAMALKPLLAERVVLWVIHLLPARLHPPLERMVRSGLAGLRVLRSVRNVAAGLALSLVAWLCEGTMYYTIALGFFPGVPFYVMLLTVAVANIGTMIPSSPGYVGTFDALAVMTLGLFGIGSEIGLAYTAVLHAVLIVPVTLLGFFYLWRENLSLAGARKMAATATVVAEPYNPVRSSN
ncbi:MAG: lysylphosphatidylglycerol synthase transmembrane domain-containing protein, partial [Chloroflexota bacterium]